MCTRCARERRSVTNKETSPATHQQKRARRFLSKDARPIPAAEAGGGDVGGREGGEDEERERELHGWPSLVGGSMVSYGCDCK